MSSGKSVLPFEKVYKITFSPSLEMKDVCIRFSGNVFPVGYNYLIVRPVDEDSGLKIKHLKGESAEFFSEIFALKDLEKLEIRQDRFTMFFAYLDSWKHNYERFERILRKYFPEPIEVVTR